MYALHASGQPMTCCGGEMGELLPNVTDAAKEKHVPVATEENGVVRVTVASVPHPMEEKHFIQWIALETNQGVSFKTLKPGEAAEARFALLPGEQPVAAYEFCNLHGLWKKEC